MFVIFTYIILFNLCNNSIIFLISKIGINALPAFTQLGYRETWIKVIQHKSVLIIVIIYCFWEGIQKMATYLVSGFCYVNRWLIPLLGYRLFWGYQMSYSFWGKPNSRAMSRHRKDVLNRCQQRRCCYLLDVDKKTEVLRQWAMCPQPCSWWGARPGFCWRLWLLGSSMILKFALLFTPLYFHVSSFVKSLITT